jgi:uncharacterized protein DUF4261
MNEHRQPSAQSPPFPTRHGTLIVARAHAPPTMVQLWAAAKSMVPDVVIGDWSGVIYDEQTANSGAIVMLRFADAMSAAVLCVDAPPPAPSIDLGPYPNVIWQSAPEELKTGAAYIMVQAIDPVSTAAQAVRRARSLTLLTSVVASLVPAIGIVSVAGANALPPETFGSIAGEAYLDALQGVPFWVRVTCARVALPNAGSEVHAYTLGLAAFGIPELEYVDLKPGLPSVMRHAYWLAQYLIETGVVFKDGEQIGAPDYPMARVALVKARGDDAGDMYRIRWES